LRISFLLILTTHCDVSPPSTFFLLIASLLLATELAAAFRAWPQALLNEEPLQIVDYIQKWGIWNRL